MRMLLGVVVLAMAACSGASSSTGPDGGAGLVDDAAPKADMHAEVTTCDPSWVQGTPGYTVESCQLGCAVMPQAAPCTDATRPCIDASRVCDGASSPGHGPPERCFGTFEVNGVRGCCNLSDGVKYKSVQPIFFQCP